ncbi:tRNA (5-methylaminomethyl-2-thiouridine)(34)-methyltransferase MnmD [Deinococcus lacus]|uniref:tRNA (5-methylaminomethyl-2-thiouridine)(34)-methyltransferase MnmD n=1 Tax=Deinococcus lacus TaxID=392561 RepID=A0ABW1YBC0_9DEIO
MQEPQVLVTPDGSRTAYSARYGETYGSRHGAAAQAGHVFVRGSGTDTHPAPQVLEVGFGLGVNFRATLAARAGQALDYLAYEFDPAPASLLAEVAQGEPGSDHPIWPLLLESWPAQPTGELRLEAGEVRLRVIFVDIRAAELPQNWATALYLDGFSPARNPEVWTPELLLRLARALRGGGVLTTYSAAGHVRRALQAAGLQVSRQPGPPGKREYLRAVRP